jgi:hypothetical protein
MRCPCQVGANSVSASCHRCSDQCCRTRRAPAVVALGCAALAQMRKTLELSLCFRWIARPVGGSLSARRGRRRGRGLAPGPGMPMCHQLSFLPRRSVCGCPGRDSGHRADQATRNPTLGCGCVLPRSAVLRRAKGAEAERTDIQSHDNRGDRREEAAYVPLRHPPHISDLPFDLDALTPISRSVAEKQQVRREVTRRRGREAGCTERVGGRLWWGGWWR